MGLKAKIRAKKAYRHPAMGEISEHLLKRRFKARKPNEKMADRRYRTQRKGRQTVPIADIGLVQQGNRRLRHEPQSRQRNGEGNARKKPHPV